MLRRRVPDETRGLEVRQPKIDIGRVQEVRFRRQRGISVERQRTIVAGPIGETLDQVELIDVRALDGQGQVVEGPPCGPGP